MILHLLTLFWRGQKCVKIKCVSKCCEINGGTILYQQVVSLPRRPAAPPTTEVEKIGAAAPTAAWAAPAAAIKANPPATTGKLTEKYNKF